MDVAFVIIRIKILMKSRDKKGHEKLLTTGEEVNAVTLFQTPLIILVEVW